MLQHSKYGWTVTTLAPEAEAWIVSALGDTGINANRLPATGSSKGGRKKSINRSIKYICIQPAVPQKVMPAVPVPRCQLLLS